jgi:Amt family ammonium transporter
VLFMLFGATLVFFMQVGFALLEVGSVSIRNTKNTLFKNLLDVCCGALTFYLVGYGLLYGEGNGFAGGTKFAMSSGDFDVSFDNSVSENGVAAKSHARFVFAFAFAATSSTIVSGALAERFMFKAYALYSATITGLLYPIVAHWTWSEDGWASPLKAQGTRLFGSGAVDYGGACVVHVTGGLAAFIACIVVGPRVGRFNAGIPMPMPMQSPVFQTAGTMFLWFGWYGFNCVAVGSLEGGNAAIAAKAAVATTLAAAAGGGATMLTDAYMWPKKLEPRRMNNGILCGLVAVSGCAGLVEPWAAVLIGALAGLIYVISSYFLLVWHVDDVVDAVPVHFFGGIWGIIAPALFTNETDYVLRYGHPTDSQEGGICGLFMGCASGGAILGANVVLLISSVAWIGVTSWVSLLLIKRGLSSLRVRVQDEMKGMDASQHGGRSYTEFQTTVFTFKTPGGGEHSMEMRVRAGDAAKFAMALSEVMENSSNGSDRAASRGGSTRSGASDAATDARMVFKTEEGGEAMPFGGALNNGLVSLDHVVVSDGNVAYANHSVAAPSQTRGVNPPLAGSGGSMPGKVSRSHSQSSHVSLTVVDEDTGSGRASPSLGMTKDGEPFDPFEDANKQ